jgi:predicted nucleic acid-binding protein
MIVLDTNVISEIMRETPDGRVMAWLGRQKTLHLAVNRKC